jgi:hypothetical protein
MELNELKSMWHTYDAKIEKTLKLNQRFFEIMQSQKVKSRLTPLLWQRIIELAFHTAAIVLLSIFLYWNFYELPYAASAVLLIAFYSVALVNCIKQIRIIKQMDYSNDLVSIQSSLVILQTNLLNYARLTILCIPAFLAYPVVVSKALKDFHLKSFGNFDIIAASNGNWWTAQFFSTIVLIPLCIWVYKEISYKNIHKEWVKDFIQISSGKRVRKSIEFMNELESLRQ